MLDLTPGLQREGVCLLAGSHDSGQRWDLGLPTERTGPFWVYSAPEGLTVWLQKYTTIAERFSRLR